MESSVEAASFVLFPQLPFELRLAIIEEFLRESSDWLAKYATIDRQWQSEVEKRTFHSLKLDAPRNVGPDDLDELERICVGDRVNSVSKIRLEIILANLNGRIKASSTDGTHGSTKEASGDEWDFETDPLVLRAERIATKVFGRFFRILKGWSRDQEPLSLTYEFQCPRSRMSPTLFDGVHLRIDSSSFPEVACVGSLKLDDRFNWGIQAASTFELLMKLPSAKNATIPFGRDLESTDVIRSIQEGHATPSFQGSEIRELSLVSTALWHTRGDRTLDLHASLELSRAIFSVTHRLEKLYLGHTVDVSHFLRAASSLSGNTPQSDPAWPNMRILCVDGYLSSSPSDDPSVNAELCESITMALPHMPNIRRLNVSVTSPSFVNARSYWDSAHVQITLPARDDRSVMSHGELFLYGVRPDEETIDEWQRIARIQWHCKLDRWPKNVNSESVQGQPLGDPSVADIQRTSSEGTSQPYDPLMFTDEV